MAVPVCGPLCCPSSSSAKKVQIMRVMMTITPRPIRRCVPTGAWSLAGADILVWHTKHAKFNQISSSSPPVTYRPIQRFQFNNKKGRHFPLFFYKKKSSDRSDVIAAAYAAHRRGADSFQCPKKAKPKFFSSTTGQILEPQPQTEWGEGNNKKISQK